MLRTVNPIILGVIRRGKAVYFIVIIRTCASRYKLPALAEDSAQTLAKLGAQRGGPIAPFNI